MAKGVFTFRITSEGVDELKAKLAQLGPAGKAAFEQLRQMSPQLQSAFAAAGKSADDTRKKIEALPTGLSAVSNNFQKAEGAAKAVNRTLNDAVGTFQLLGGATGAAGQNLAALGSVIGNVSDVFGTLGNLLGKHPLLAIGSTVALAATAFITFRDKSVEATKAQEELQKALAATNELLLSQAELAVQAAEKQRRAAVVDVETAKASNQRLLDDAKRSTEALEGQIAEERRRAAAQQSGNVNFGFLGMQTRPLDQERAAKRLADLEKELADRRRVVDDLERRRQQLDPTALSERRRFLEEAATAEQEQRARQQAYIDQLNRENESDRIISERRQREAEAAAKIAEAEMAAWEAFEQRQAQLIEATVTANQKRNESVEKYIAKLEEEAKFAGETNEHREVGLRIYEAQSKLVDELGNKTRDLTELEKERIAAAVKTKEAMEQQQKAAEKVQREIERAAQQSTDRLVDFAGDSLFDRLTGKVTNFWDSFRDYGLRVISQLAAEMVFRPIVAPIIGAATAAAPGLFGIGGGASASTSGLVGGSGGGIGSLFSSPLSSVFSLGSSLVQNGGLFGSGLGSVGGALSGLTSPFTALGGAIGGALGLQVGTAGAMVGASAVGGPAFLGGATSLAGGAGALGAGIMSPLMATGIGALVAIPALIGLAGLFGKKKNVGPFASYASWLNPDGSMTFKGGGEKNGGSMAQMQEATQALADSIKQVSRTLGIYTLPILDVGVGSNKERGTFYGTGGSEGAAVYYGTDAGEAGAAYVRAALQGSLYGGSRITPSTEAARLFAMTTGNVKSDLEFVAVYQGLDAASAAASQLTMALDELNAKFDVYADTARRYGLEVDRIEKARQQAIDAQTASFLQPLGTRLSGISGLVASLTVGAASPLSAEQQLSAARGQFETLAASARAGDESAQTALGDAGRAYLDVARGFYATTEPYANIFGNVIGQLGDIVRSVRDTDPTVRAIVETGERGTAAVTKLLGKLIESVDTLSSEVRRSNDVPMRLTA